MDDKVDISNRDDINISDSNEVIFSDWKSWGAKLDFNDAHVENLSI